jgi:photosystem II stability/assembly factor-like uncharacterized protein
MSTFRWWATSTVCALLLAAAGRPAESLLVASASHQRPSSSHLRPLAMPASPGVRRWQIVARLPAPDGSLGGIDCPTEHVCEAIGADGYATTATGPTPFYRSNDGGAHWQFQSVGPAGERFDSLSCASATTCLVAGFVAVAATQAPDTVALMRTSDGGATWTPVGSLPAGAFFLDNAAPPSYPELACTAPAVCELVAGNHLYRTTDDGTSWAAQLIPAVSSGAAYLVGVACASSSDCTALADNTSGLGDELFSTRDGGSAWSTTYHDAHDRADVITCSSASSCLVGAIGPVPLGPVPLLGAGTPIPSATEHLLVLHSADGGAHWSTVAIPVSYEVPDALACASVDRCVLLAGNAVYRSADAGRRWSRQALSPNDATAVYSLACPTAERCLAATAGGPVLVPARGRGWAPQLLVTSIRLTGLSCDPSGDCRAVGTSVVAPQITEAVLLELSKSGTVVGRAAGLGIFFNQYEMTTEYPSITCPSSSACLLDEAQFGGADGLNPYLLGRVELGHGRPVFSQTLNAPSAWYEVACATPQDCLALRYDLYGGNQWFAVASSDGGRTWSSGRVVPGLDGSDLVDLSCPAAQLCLLAAGDTTGHGLLLRTDDLGDSWTSEQLPGGQAPLSAVSCASATVCQAGGPVPPYGVIAGSRAVLSAPVEDDFLLRSVDGGDTWSLATAPWQGDQLAELDCYQTEACEAVVDGPTSSAIFGTSDGGQTWHRQALAGGVRVGGGASCLGAGQCIGLSGVSCSASGACLALAGDPAHLSTVLLRLR